MFCRESSVRIQCQPDADSQCNTRGKRKALVSPFSGVSRNPAARLNAATARIIRGAGRQNRLKNFRQGGCLKPPAGPHRRVEAEGSDGKNNQGGGPPKSPQKFPPRRLPEATGRPPVLLERQSTRRRHGQRQQISGAVQLVERGQNPSCRGEPCGKQNPDDR